MRIILLTFNEKNNPPIRVKLHISWKLLLIRFVSIQVDYDQQFDKYVAIFVKFDCFCNKFIDVQRGRLPVSLCVRDHM